MEGGGTRRWPLVTAALVLVLVVKCKAQGERKSYSVVAPSTIRPNTDYFAAITMGGITGDLQVDLINPSAIKRWQFAGGAVQNLRPNSKRPEH